jgi:hypothetical protein
MQLTVLAVPDCPNAPVQTLGAFRTDLPTGIPDIVGQSWVVGTPGAEAALCPALCSAYTRPLPFLVILPGL